MRTHPHTPSLLDEVMHAYKLSTQESEAGGLSIDVASLGYIMRPRLPGLPQTTKLMSR